MEKLLYSGPSFAELHEKYAKKNKIDDQAQIVSESSVVINSPAEIVWRIVSDIESYPKFAPDFSKIRAPKLLVDRPISFSIKGFPIHGVLANVTPNRFLTWTGKSLWTKAVDYHEIQDLGDGTCRLIVRESLAGMFVPWFFSEEKLKQQHLAWLDCVKKSAEDIASK